VGYVRRNFLVPLPAFRDYGELNAYLLDCCEQDAKRRRRFGRTVRELWQEERARLRPLPQQLPAACTTVMARVNRRQQVRLNGNRYSTPPEYVGRLVTIHAYVFRVAIACPFKVEFLRICYQVSIQRASQTLPGPRSTLYYGSRRPEQPALKKRIKGICRSPG
jgi:hypothetical protein